MSVNRVIVGSAVGVSVAVAAVVAWLNRPAPDQPLAQPAAPTIVPSAPVAQTATQTATQADVQGDRQPDSPPAGPEVTDLLFDDAGAVVSGTAVPGAAVVLRIDGSQVAEVSADSSGAFVAIFFLEPVAEAQVLTLDMILPDGRVIPGRASTVLLPRLSAVAEVPAVADGMDSAEAPVDLAMAEPADITEPPVPAESAGIDADAALAAAAGQPDDVVPPSQPVSSQPVGVTPPDAPSLALAATDALPADPAQTSAEPLSPAPRALTLRADGGVDLAGMATSGLVNVVIDSISYATDGAVQITGRTASRGAGADAALRVYLDNAAVAETRAQAGVWRVDLADVTPGIYALRVDQLDAGGVVVSRFETPFLRETPENIARAVTSPAVTPTVAQTVEQTVTPPVDAPAPVDRATDNTPVSTDAVPAQLAEAPRPLPQPPVSGPAQPEPQPEPQPAPEPTAPQIAAAPEPARESAPEPAAEPVPPVAQVTQPERATQQQTAAAEQPAAQPAAQPVQQPVQQPGEQIAQAPLPVPQPAPEPAAVPAPEPAAPVAARPEPATEPVARAVVPAPAPVADPAPVPRVTAVTVQPGHTLWAISREHYGEGVRYVQIFQANRSQIRNPDLIYPGQIFTLPD